MDKILESYYIRCYLNFAEYIDETENPDYTPFPLDLEINLLEEGWTFNELNGVIKCYRGQVNKIIQLYPGMTPVKKAKLPSNFKQIGAKLYLPTSSWHHLKTLLAIEYGCPRDRNCPLCPKCQKLMTKKNFNYWI
jgi:hypothetical protein